MITSVSTATPSPNKVTSAKGGLKAEDFIKMMVTQLQNQDPLEPAKNGELLAQMSQIGQLQSSTSLQESLKGLVLQNQIGSASSLIGKMISGVNDQGKQTSGLVNSIKVDSVNNEVRLELDSGQDVSLGKVLSITPASAATGS